MLNDKVLIVSDDSRTADLWSFICRQIGLSTLQKSPNQNLSDIHVEQVFDLILIDDCGSESDFLTFVQNIRIELAVPLLLLIPTYDETYLLEAYRLGIDECIVKPVSPRLLQAKLEAWLNRSWTVPATMLDAFTVGDVTLDPTQRKYIDSEGMLVKLTNLEFRLLHLLMTHAGQVMEVGLIINRVWGYTSGSNSTLLKNMVYRLRRKIEPDPRNPQYILSASGEGYLFRGQ